MLKRLFKGFRLLEKNEGSLPYILPFFAIMFSGIGSLMIFVTGNVPRIPSIIFGTFCVMMGIGFFILLVALCWKHGNGKEGGDGKAS